MDKLDILARLLKEGHITIEEFKLLSVKEIEVKYEYVNPPYFAWTEKTILPYIYPLNPYEITCDSAGNKHYTTSNLMSFTTDGDKS